MTNILTAAEAANVLRCLTTDALMLQLLPQVDKYINTATGRDWTADTTIEPTAKAAAQMLLVMWHENPAMLASGLNSLNWGLSAALTQLEALALTLETASVPEEALELEASSPADGAIMAGVIIAPVLVFNHAMIAGATSAVVLRTAAGVTKASTNTLDVTKKILTITPTSSLTAATDYEIVLTAAADIYGMTLTQTLRFRTV